MQQEIMDRDFLLDEQGRLKHKGYSKKYLLTYNPEKIGLTPYPLLNRLRLKEWDYYALTTPEYFFSVAVSHIGYLGLAFAYYIDFAAKKMMENTIATPFGQGCTLPRTSEAGDIHYHQHGVDISFLRLPERRLLTVNWPRFNKGTDLSAELELQQPAALDSIVMATPMGDHHFYYNHKINCMPAAGWIRIGKTALTVHPGSALTGLDWGRGVWPYRTFWNWASASGFLPDGRTIGLNLGQGFGDLSYATENCFYLDGRMTKLAELDWSYDARDYMKPWSLSAGDGQAKLEFQPFFERITKIDLLALRTEVHQMFGRYNGHFIAATGDKIEIRNLIGWAEEHKARW